MDTVQVALEMAWKYLEGGGVGVGGLAGTLWNTQCHLQNCVESGATEVSWKKKQIKRNRGGWESNQEVVEPKDGALPLAPHRHGKDNCEER